MKNFWKENSALVAVSWGHFVNDFFMSIVPVTLFAFAEELNLNATQMSFILFVITSSGSFFQPIVGLLIDKVQKSVLLIYALTAITIGMSLSGLISNFYFLVLVVGISALGSSVYHPLGSTITIHKTGLSRGKSLSFFMTVGTFAHTAAPLIAIPLVTIYGLKALAVLIIPGLLSAFLLYVTKVHKVKWTKEEKKEKTKKLLTNKQQLNLAMPMTIAVIKGVLYRVILVFGVIIMGLKGIEPVFAGFVLSGFMLARTVATLAGGFLSDHIGENNTLKLFNTLALGAVLLIVYTKGFLLVIGIVLLGFCLNGTASSNITIVHKIIPNNPNFGTGLIMGFAMTMSAALMLGYGMIIDLYGHIEVLNILVIITFVMAILSFLIPKEI